MPFLTRRAVPRMIAIRLACNLTYLVFIVALGAVPPRCTTIGDLMPVFTIGAIPRVFTEGLRI